MKAEMCHLFYTHISFSVIDHVHKIIRKKI